MTRRGWRAVETPQGWFNVIRGPRPPSEKWPMAQGTVSRQSREAWSLGTTSRRSRSLSHSVFSARTGAHISRGECRSGTATLNWKEHWQHLGRDWPEVTMLQNSLKAVKKAAQEPPLEVQFVRVVRFEAQIGWWLTTKQGSCWRQRAILAQGHFCSNTALLSRAVSWLFGTFASSSDMAVHAAQEIDSRRMVPGHPRAATKVAPGQQWSPSSSSW